MFQAFKIPDAHVDLEIGFAHHWLNLFNVVEDFIAMLFIAFKETEPFYAEGATTAISLVAQLACVCNCLCSALILQYGLGAVGV